MLLAEDGKYIYCSYLPGKVLVVAVDTGELITQLEYPLDPYPAYFRDLHSSIAVGNGLIFVGSPAGWIRVWQTESWEHIAKFRAHWQNEFYYSDGGSAWDESIGAMFDVTYGDNKLYTGGWDQTIRIWHPSSIGGWRQPEKVCEIKFITNNQTGSGVASLHYNENGFLLFTTLFCNLDQMIIWDANPQVLHLPTDQKGWMGHPLAFPYGYIYKPGEFPVTRRKDCYLVREIPNRFSVWQWKDLLSPELRTWANGLLYNQRDLERYKPNPGCVLKSKEPQVKQDRGISKICSLKKALIGKKREDRGQLRMWDEKVDLWTPILTWEPETYDNPVRELLGIGTRTIAVLHFGGRRGAKRPVLRVWDVSSEELLGLHRAIWDTKPLSDANFPMIKGEGADSQIPWPTGQWIED